MILHFSTRTKLLFHFFKEIENFENLILTTEVRTVREVTTLIVPLFPVKSTKDSKLSKIKEALLDYKPVFKNDSYLQSKG